MQPLSRPGFWAATAAAVGLVVLMLVLLFGHTSFRSQSEDDLSGDSNPVTVFCDSVANGVDDGPRGLTVAGSHSDEEESAWGVHCATLRSQRTGWLAVLAVPASVLTLLSLVWRPEDPMARGPKPKVGPIYTPRIE